ncbi:MULTISPECIES: response regulator transcription factor [unclassified Pseudomonas]|uniref:response regulator transcription factor n=1 Tax=unclassified Pseudomonas TaxID=196821 RepID=UPI001F56E0BD|nr:MULTISPECIES: response regulator transcription factor [unclassified Pseudomonas]
MNTALIVDNHPLVRAAVRGILKRENLQIIAETGDGASAIDLVREHVPDLLILELELPLLDGLTVMERLRKDNLKTKVIIFTSLSHESYLRRCKDSGVSAFILKNEEIQELKRAVSETLQGRTYFPGDTRGLYRCDISAREGELVKNLSNRELTILKYLAMGKSNKEISALLFISNKTVSTYKFRIYEKINTNNIVDLSKFAIRNHLT